MEVYHSINPVPSGDYPPVGVLSQATPNKWPVRININLGTHKSSSELYQSLEDNKFIVGDTATDILGRITVAPKRVQVGLVFTTVYGLGFPEGATFEDVYNKASRVGLSKCPAEVGPQLRLQINQADDDIQIIFMEPIAGSDDHLRLFSVLNMSGRRLGSHAARCFGPSDSLVFRCR